MTAGRGDRGPVDLLARIHLGFDFMGAVTTDAVGGDQKAALGQGPAMNRIHVELVRIGHRNAMPLRQLRISVACAASPGQVQGINFRVRMFGGQDIVAPMAVAAERYVAVAFRMGLSMNALRVNLEGTRMTGGALYGFQFWRMGNLRGISVTRRAFKTAVDRLRKLFPVDVKRHGLSLTNLLHPLRPVARKTDLLGSGLSRDRNRREKKNNKKNSGSQEGICPPQG